MTKLRCIALWRAPTPNDIRTYEATELSDKTIAVVWCHKREQSTDRSLLWAVVINMEDDTVYYHSDQRPSLASLVTQV